MRNLGFVEITLLCSFFVYIRIHNVFCLNSDGLILLSLLKHFDNVPPNVASTWEKNTSESTPCTWFGVICNNFDNVETLDLAASGVSGQLGSEIGELKSLVYLYLDYNNFSGLLPSSLGNCTSLEDLVLSNNTFRGEIPDSFGSLQNLKYMYLDRNNLTGPIPSSVGGLKELEELNMSHNELSSTIPEAIGNCTKLKYLALNKNKLNGSLPQSLNLLENLGELFVNNNSLGGRLQFGSSNFKKLVKLDLSFNEFEGGVPPEIGNCSNLQSLSIIKCNLTGTIPSSLGLLKKVSYLALSQNRLSGNIPQELGNCSSLDTLMLHENQLQGEIPPALGKLKKLKSLELYHNKLSGEIPIDIWKIQSLTEMLVYQNTLTGELPIEVTQLKNLTKLTLFNNRFYGEIPMSLGVNRSLEEVDLLGNNFTGKIPPNLCHGHKLRIFVLGSNQLHGKIPAFVRQCKTLERVRLEENKLSGLLPEFPECLNLSYINMTGNNFRGPIPRSLGSCKNLQTIDLSQNKLTGMIPPELGNLQNLQGLYLSHNRLKGPLPSQLSGCARMLEFDVGSNSLNGSVPSSFRSWKSLSTLVLSDNHFSEAIPPFLVELHSLSDLRIARNAFGGEIPSSVGLLTNLRYGLDLSGNIFTGEIPTALGNLGNLIRLNISNNKLTGSLSTLTRLQSLLEVDVSYNQLKGPIEEKLLSISSFFLGNSNLCIESTYSVSDIIRSEFKFCKGQAKLSTCKIALIAAGSFLSVSALLFALVLVFHRCKSRAKTQDANVLVEEGLSLLLNRVLAATDNLDEKYIIGRGAHGVVYRASLGSGEDYAVKKLIFAEHIRAKQNMKREIETIGLVRHRNLIRLERSWIRQEDGLMLYQYMPNGSLHDVLHRRNQGEAVLDWSARFNIALGVAHGLAYLHHDCYPPIIHRDIKPENILMDSDMEPHIGDFGLARILDDSTVSTATITGTTGYIAPENAYKTMRSKESDVYSYGVVLFELVTGKRAVDKSFSEVTDIVSWVRSVLSSYEDDDDTAGPIVDPTLVDDILDTNRKEQAIQVTDLALRCTDKRPENRPSMRDVIKYLTEVKDFARSTSDSIQ